ncbi:hypothetical protein LTR99_009756 [Exophiala xenobiotica]|uniref:BTB domain-containing protein n=1 Tax=Vermiconidia calcicola TaxID=1690605 RepID=A0AAV9Q0H0_9PEZI|nr:hypothetical protein LTR96_007116 [Exophiala xenobiotica]KAK5530595.1 hypothetical protein LTR25_009173 [Vermiconidia calcicola]KAK5532180.1 hypothetical protein LTR23_009622 [Chaetothyriales sp. CCFEE 6169]KAK5294358.1 hypothetical protein LTR99_009756 [Exophiala xenobiotica]KAK5336251.1 hypothetical protein LTR98_007581 [Exophiala xenobiotica]
MALTRKKSFKFSNEMVTLVFSEGLFTEGKIVVHREVLMQSAYFQKQIAIKDATFGEKVVLYLKGCTKATGIEMANWLYSATSSSFTFDGSKPPHTEAVDHGWRLVDAYRLARETNLEEWANSLADACLEMLDQDLLWLEYLQRLNAHEEPDTGLVGLLFTALARAIRRHGWEKYVNSIDKSFLKALRENGEFGARLMKRVLESEGLSEKSLKKKSCKWHIHNITPHCGGN